MVYAMASIGFLGFCVWSHHMYVVGLDTDTISQIVSLNMVTYLLLINYMLKTLYKIKIHLQLKLINIIYNYQIINYNIILYVFGKIFNLLIYIIIIIYYYILYIIIFMNQYIFNKQSAGNLTLLNKYILLNIYNSLSLKLFFLDISKKITSDISEHLSYYYKNNKNDSSKIVLDDDELFGYYLAGLIEGDGYIGKKEISIAFHIKDIKNAYWLKKRIGYGKVLPYSHTKNVIRLCFYDKKSREQIFKLINGKFLGPQKLNNLIKYEYDKEFNIIIKPLQTFNLWDNPWFTGFTDADGSFGIDISKSNTHKLGLNVKIHLRIKQKYNHNLIIIKEYFGGNLYLINKNKDIKIYQYSSTNFKTSYNIIKYFDKYPPLNNSKYIHYLKWRKVYLLIQNKEHLNKEGINKIIQIKKNLRD